MLLRVKSSIRLCVTQHLCDAGFLAAEIAILQSHWVSWLGFGMTINPAKRKTKTKRKLALGQVIER